MNPGNRRQFLKTSAVMAGATFAPNILLGQDKALKKLNVAAVGCGGKGGSDISQIAPSNQIVALCDVDHKRAAGAFGKFPEAKTFFDYREMFSEMADEIDVVTVSTPDHMHFPIAVAAIQAGKPVFVQKPLANTLWETRALADLAKKHDVLTVMGNQGATNAGTRVLREWIEAGVIGEVTEVHYWTNRPIWPQGPGLEFPKQPVPETLNWEVWQGSVATDRPYSPKIHPFAWRGFWDYGCGALGDIGCHSFNSAFWALDLHGDFEVEATQVSEFDEDIAPKRTTIVFDFPEKKGRAPVKIIWQDGVADPNKDEKFIRPPGIPDDLELGREFGQVFVGTKGVIYCPDAYCGATPKLYPESLREEARKVPKVYARVSGGPTQELCRAIRGDGEKPLSNFTDHAGPLTEMVLVGNLAVRLGKKINWDSAKLEARGLPEAQKFIKRTYRQGWEPDLG
ncbi:Gfo/Idh/MocA family protein [Haloferula rosea]|uniref:Gfo/Idh/MocA family oxidoreductase n=1 Tax=Haloferula rosea TaxID=490093 RepID=A0A934RH93_9BACT|nr:Gfo/Idh/MocA family oxidoreductase [Haloferula rosea]MBK1828300.1 Gfo/Idh/MocA family oxidoreductase [Haloferula rosea]